jgi:hypothetical protein
MDPMNDAALEREIERALAVDPSPEFLVRVRARIADEPAPASRGFGWLFAGVATVAAAAVLVLAVRMVSPARPPATAPLLASRAIGSSIVVPSSDPSTRGPASAYAAARPPRDEKAGHDVPKASPAATRTREPLFDARETTALQRLIADVRDARVDLAPLAKEGPMPLPDMDPLVISPIVIEPLTPGGVEGERP